MEDLTEAFQLLKGPMGKKERESWNEVIGQEVMALNRKDRRFRLDVRKKVFT